MVVSIRVERPAIIYSSLIEQHTKAWIGGEPFIRRQSRPMMIWAVFGRARHLLNDHLTVDDLLTIGIAYHHKVYASSFAAEINIVQRVRARNIDLCIIDAHAL